MAAAAVLAAAGGFAADATEGLALVAAAALGACDAVALDTAGFGAGSFVLETAASCVCFFGGGWRPNMKKSAKPSTPKPVVSNNATSARGGSEKTARSAHATSSTRAPITSTLRLDSEGGRSGRRARETAMVCKAHIS